MSGWYKSGDSPEEQAESRSQRERRRGRTPTVLLIGVIVLSLICTGAALLIYIGYAQETSDQRWCALLESLDQPTEPATTERAKVIQRQIRQLRKDFHCDLKGSTLPS